MEFYTVSSQKRPVRLSAQTRQFAWDSLHGRYGDEAMQHFAVQIDNIEGYANMTQSERYDAALLEIAARAPVRICEYELISGAATLGSAIHHVVPVTYRGEHPWSSISHVTLGFDRVVRLGMNAIERQVLDRLNGSCSAEETEQLAGMKNAVDAMHMWHGRYLSALKDTKPHIYGNLLQVPFEPAGTFYEAVQSLWFAFAFTRLCGNWSGIGRIDEILGGYLKRDIECGLLTIEEAREILASFFIKGCEWIQSDTPVGSGDSQHYQNIVLSGVDESGRDITNEVTYLVLDIVEELGISDFPITVRISGSTAHKLLERTAQVMRHGGGVVAIYNETLIIDSLVKSGYPLEEARRFANDGCWEVQVPGNTLFSYVSIDSLRILLEDTLNLAGEPACFDSAEVLYNTFYCNMERELERIYNKSVRGKGEGSHHDQDWHWDADLPCGAVSVFEEGCIESGRSYLAGGPKYIIVSPHIGGAPDVGNSLYAISKLVFEDELVSFGELMAALKNDWEGYETLQQYAKNKYIYYGNDHDEADQYTVRVLDDFADIAWRLNHNGYISFPPGISTFGRQIDWAPLRAAVPFGYKKGEILSGNASPTPGTELEGATAVIKSYCKADLGRQVNGAALDVKLLPSTIEGENGVTALISLMEGFVKLGGYFMQLDVMDAEVLRRAQQDPQAYKTLSVRVSGWNARFITLDERWQRMIIERSAQGM